MIQTLLADDHVLVRRGIQRILDETRTIVVTDEASDGLEALAKIRKGTYDICVLDFTMPKLNGLEVVKHMKSAGITIPVLILSMHPETLLGIRSLRAGAAGYLTKEHAPEELVCAIRQIANGRKYITPTLAEHLATNLDATFRAPHEILSDREYEVLRMIASGKTATQIAEEMYLSVKTISTYRTRLLQKMQMKSNAELTHYAIMKSLVDLGV